MAESMRERRNRLNRIKRPRLNARRKRRERGRAAMKLKTENYKIWLDTVIGRLEGLLEKESQDGEE